LINETKIQRQPIETMSLEELNCQFYLIATTSIVPIHDWQKTQLGKKFSEKSRSWLQKRTFVWVKSRIGIGWSAI